MSAGWEDRGAVARVGARADLTMRFDGMAYPLEDYGRPLEAAGLVIEAIREPVPVAECRGTPGTRAVGALGRIPMFLMWRARRPAAG